MSYRMQEQHHAATHHDAGRARRRAVRCALSPPHQGEQSRWETDGRGDDDMSCKYMSKRDKGEGEWRLGTSKSSNVKK